MRDRAPERTRKDPLRRVRPSCVQPAGRGRRPGFTIPEMVVVLGIIGVMSLLVAPHMEIVRFRMDGTARGYVAAMIAAQRLAVQQQHDVVVRIDTAARRIEIHEDADNDGTVDAGERVRPLPLDESVRFDRGAAPARTPYGAAVTFSAGADGVPTFRFTRAGSASEDGAFYLTSARAASGSGDADDTRMIQVERATGRASWYHFDPPSWELGF